MLQNCATFNKVNTVTWFKDHTYKLEDEGHDPTDRNAAFQRAIDESRLATGIFYQDEREAYDEDVPAERGLPLVDHDLSKTDITQTMNEFM